MKTAMKVKTAKTMVAALALAAVLVLAAALPALAGYAFLGNFYSDTWAEYTEKGIDGKKTWSNPSYDNPAYQYTQNQRFFVNGVQQTDETKVDAPGEFTDFVTGMYEYIIIKGGAYQSGGYVDLYQYAAAGDPVNLGNYTTGQAISHISGYNPVPVPGAGLLLGSGLIGLVGVMRRRSVRG
jgi:hypothetical protein